MVSGSAEATGGGPRIRRGDPAPAFRLEGTEGTLASHREHALAEYLGKPVVLVFYPGDDTPVCTEQLSSYTQDVGGFHALGAQVLAISPQGLESHDRFAAGNGGFGFPLLADVDRQVGDRYGIVGPLGFYRRSVFVIDAGGIIRWIHRSIGGLSFQPTEKLLAAVQRIS